nr:reverse transcriptase domain-containing protein [Tanacetum cinerariifolium]
MMGEVDINTLTMEQYLALTRGNQTLDVVKPEIGGNHVERVLDIVSLFNIPGVTHDAVMLRVFPITLTGAAKRSDSELCDNCDLSRLVSWLGTSLKCQFVLHLYVCALCESWVIWDDDLDHMIDIMVNEVMVYGNFTSSQVVTVEMIVRKFVELYFLFTYYCWLNELVLSVYGKLVMLEIVKVLQCGRVVVKLACTAFGMARVVVTFLCRVSTRSNTDCEGPCRWVPTEMKELLEQLQGFHGVNEPGDVRTLIMEEAHAMKYSVRPEAEIGESKMIGLEMKQETTKVVVIKERLKEAKDLVVRCGKKGELAPRYVRPFEILTRIGHEAYRLGLRFPKDLSSVLDMIWDDDWDHMIDIMVNEVMVYGNFTSSQVVTVEMIVRKFAELYFYLRIIVVDNGNRVAYYMQCYVNS